MAVTLAASGAQAATLNTEHSLNTQSAVAGVFSANIDVSAMAAGDILEIRVYEKAQQVSNTKRVAQLMRIRGPASSPIKRLLPVPTTLYWELTLKQVAGTGRTYPWSVFQS